MSSEGTWLYIFQSQPTSELYCSTEMQFYGSSERSINQCQCMVCFAIFQPERFIISKIIVMLSQALLSWRLIKYALASMRPQIRDLVWIGTKVPKWSQKSLNFAPGSKFLSSPSDIAKKRRITTDRDWCDLCGHIFSTFKPFYVYWRDHNMLWLCAISRFLRFNMMMTLMSLLLLMKFYI